MSGVHRLDCLADCLAGYRQHPSAYVITNLDRIINARLQQARSIYASHCLGTDHAATADHVTAGMDPQLHELKMLKPQPQL